MVHYRGGRAAIDPSRVPRRRRVLERPDLDLRRPGQGGRRAGRSLPAVRRHHPRLPQRPGPARADGEQGRGRRAPARDLHPPHQRGARRQARGADRDHAPVPRATSAPRGRPRAATTSSPRRCSESWTSTGSSSSTTTRARAGSSRCGSCPRASSSCSGWSRPSAASSSPRTSSSAGSRRPRSSSDRAAVPVAAVRLLLDGRGQRPQLRAGGRQARLIVETAGRGLGPVGRRAAMRAAVTQAVGAMAVLDRPEPPDPGPGEVVIQPRGDRDLRLGLPLLRRRAVRGGRRLAVPARARTRGRRRRSPPSGPDCRERADGRPAGRAVAAAGLRPLLPVQRRPREHLRQLPADRDPRRRRHAGAACASPPEHVFPIDVDDPAVAAMAEPVSIAVRAVHRARIAARRARRRARRRDRSASASAWSRASAARRCW